MLSSKLISNGGVACILLACLASAGVLHMDEVHVPLLRTASKTLRTPRANVESLTPENGLDRGDWGPMELCPSGTVVRSFEFKYSALGYLDDTAGTGIRLYCLSTTGGTSYVTSNQGQYGEWQGLRSCSHSNINAVRMEVLSYQGSSHDDIGVTNVQMACEGTSEVLTGTTIEYRQKLDSDLEDRKPLRKQTVLEDGTKIEYLSSTKSRGDVPTYGHWLYCSYGFSLCGLQTRVEKDTTVTDDAGLTDAVFICCQK